MPPNLLFLRLWCPGQPHNSPPPQLRLWKEAVVTHLKIFCYCSHDEMKTEKNACHGGRWLNPDPNPMAHNNSSCKIFALHVP